MGTAGARRESPERRAGSAEQSARGAPGIHVSSALVHDAAAHGSPLALHSFEPFAIRSRLFADWLHSFLAIPVSPAAATARERGAPGCRLFDRKAYPAFSYTWPTVAFFFSSSQPRRPTSAAMPDEILPLAEIAGVSVAARMAGAQVARGPRTPAD